MRPRFKAAARSSRKSSGRNKEMAGGILMAAGVISFYSVFFPLGIWGAHIKGGLAWAFGDLRYIFPLWAAYVGLRLTLPRPWPQGILKFSLGLSLFFFGCTLATLFGLAAFKSNFGGQVGLAGNGFLSNLFGAPGSWLISILGLSLVVSGLFRVSPVHIGAFIFSQLKSDIEEWKSARRLSSPKLPPVVTPRSLQAPDKSSSEEEDARPLVVKSAPVSQSFPGPAVRPSVVKPVERKFVMSAETETAEKLNPKTEIKTLEEPPVYKIPSFDLLSNPSPKTVHQSEDELLSNARNLEQTLANFDVVARVTDIHPGPVITRYDLEPAPGVKISSIVSLADDVALAMKATRVRILAPIPGKGAVGIEIPNPKSTMVTLKEILSDPRLQASKSPLAVALGKTSSGETYFTDLAPMPHLLVAGATGTGKSVCIHSLIMSILMRSTPDRVKFLLIDPKRLELPVYDGMPHLYDPRTGPEAAQVITQPKEASKALARMVKVMEHRYEIFAKANVRNIEGYNAKRVSQGLSPEFYIVVIIDELADLMLVSAREVEDCIQRLAQMARAVGIHLILATQRPSVDVITGVIKANLPGRIALRVASQTDSRVILDTIGAESLVGSGDMLFLPAGASAPIRLQGAYVSEKEVASVVEYLRTQGGPRYQDIFAVIAAAEAAQEDAETRQQLDEGLRLIMERKRVSQDLLKAHFGSSAKATNVLSLLEVRGFIHKPEGTNRWEIYFDKIEDFFRAPRSRPIPDEKAVTS